MPSAARTFLGGSVVGVLLFGASVLTSRTTLAFPLGTTTSAVVLDLKPRDTMCQGPIDVPSYGAFDRVVIQLGTYRARGPSLTVSVRDRVGRSIAARHLPGGYPDVDRAPRHTIQFGRLLRGRSVSVCVRNEGARKVAIYGSGDNASRTSTAQVNGRPIGRDVNLEFRRPPRSYASMLGAMLRRAALWRTPRLSGVAYGLLLVALVAGAATAGLVATKRLGRT
jgi:hypothetical protein